MSMTYIRQSQCLEVQDKPIIVVGGTDGASVYTVEHNSMKGKSQKELPWLIWTWYCAHQLEIACKNVLSSQLFSDIIEMLQRLRSLYSRSC